MSSRSPVVENQSNGGTAPPPDQAAYQRTTATDTPVQTPPVQTPPAQVQTPAYQPAYQARPAPMEITGGFPNIDRTRWGPIWAGFVTTISLFLIAEAFLMWLGALGLSNTASGGIGMNRPWVTWIIAVVAFFIGGLVVAMANPVRGAVANALNGFLVWALASAIMAGASVLGAGAIFGTVGALVSHVLRLTGSHASTVTPTSVSDLKTAAGWAFWTLLSTLIAAALGGLIAGFGRPVGWVEDTSGDLSN